MNRMHFTGAPTKGNGVKLTKIFFNVLKHVQAKKSIFAVSIFSGVLGTFFYAFASYLIGSAVQILIPTGFGLPADDGFVRLFTNINNSTVQAGAIIAFLVLLYFGYWGLQTIQNFLLVKISQATSSRLRWETYCKLQIMPIAYFDKQSSGDLMSRMTNDIDNISQALIQAASQFVQSVSMMFFTFIIMMVLSPYVTLIAVGMLFILMSFSFVFIKLAQPHFMKQQKNLGALNGYVEEMISGQKVVTLLNRQNESTAAFEKYNVALVPSAVRSQFLSSLLFPWFNFTINMLLLLTVVIFAGFSSAGIGTGGTAAFSFAFIISFISLLRNFATPLNQLLSIFNLIQAGLAGAQRVFEVIDLLPPPVNSKAQSLPRPQGYVSFKKVNFGYTPEKLNLIDANIEAKPDEVVAIVGPTGAGKTTIINLLTKFYNKNDGEIKIDTNEIGEIVDASWRDNIAIVLQDTYLFTTTIKENIRYGNLNATDEDVINAAKIADAHNFIMQLEKGYDTLVESNGSNFSQGQRQLLAIARAVIRNSEILVLDEATSSVDTRTEVQIQKALSRLIQGRTSFVIAHRLSTIRNANQILVVNDGKIVERGNHDELLNLNGFYANLYNSQFKKGITFDTDLD
ncbi:ABC transporter ATP-binding protein [[Mycoplasma] testudinis]|uniref:ABC transporter ATP-binding protein n=1 Tax=[Mycoplasma] testudinis TaxID=33924 RepID=UPI0006964897|nr:ABC transporter ATP-binding protein [[Mycoplasma] testudinis]